MSEVTGGATTYRMAPELGARAVGRSLVTLGLVVVVTTVVGVVTGAGWAPAGVVALAGALAVLGRAWWMLRAWAVRMTAEGYDVRMLRGVGAGHGSWADVTEVVAASPGGVPCLVLRSRGGHETRLPMVALAADADAFATDVRRRVRDAHSS